MFEQILAALFVLALLAGTLWLLRRKGVANVHLTLPKRFSGAKQMDRVEHISLSPHHSLHLVRVRNRTILIGISPSGCNRIASFRDSAATPKLGNDEIS